MTTNNETAAERANSTPSPESMLFDCIWCGNETPADEAHTWHNLFCSARLGYACSCGGTTECCATCCSICQFAEVDRMVAEITTAVSFTPSRRTSCPPS